MNVGSVGWAGKVGVGWRPKASGRVSSGNNSLERCRRTRAMATTDRSFRAITSTSVFSTATAASVPDGSWAQSESGMIA